MLLLLLNGSIKAQPPSFNFRHLTTANGLSDPVVRHIASDKFGYIWLGTLNGLNRFNGYDVKIFQHQAHDSLSLPDNAIQALFCDQEGSFWVALSKGIYKYNYNNSHFTFQPGSESFITRKIVQGGKNLVYVSSDRGMVSFNTKTGSFDFIHESSNGPGNNLLDKPINDFCLLAGKMYISTDSGMVVYDTRTYSTQRVNLAPLQNNMVEKLATDHAGNLWISYTENNNLVLKTDTGFTKYEVYQQFLSPRNKYKDNQVSAIFTDNKGRVWISTNRQGLCLFDPVQKGFIRYDHDPLQSSSLTNDFTTFLYQDNDGFIWTGTEGYGVDYFHPDKNLFRTIQQSVNQSPTLNDNWARAATEDDDNNLWLGTAGGVAKYDSRNHKYTLFQNIVGQPDMLLSNSIRSLIYADGMVWIGTASGLNRYHINTGKMDFLGPKDSIPVSFFWDLLKDYKNNMWIGCRGGLFRYDATTKKIDNLSSDSLLAPYRAKNVRTLFEDSHHRLWIGFYNGGLLMYDPENKRRLLFTKKSYTETSLDDDNVTSITEDKSGVIWIATLTNLSSYDVNTSTFKHYRNNEANISEITSCLMVDDKNRLWLASSRGLYVLDAARQSFRSFDIGDGLPTVDFNNQRAFKMHNGNFVYPTLKGFVVFNPLDYKEKNDSIKVYISSFKIFGKEINPPSAIEQVGLIKLGHSQNFFSLEMTALNYANPHQNWYAYKLEPFDKDWIYTKERLVNYTNVPGGAYNFYYKVSTDKEKWNVPVKTVQIFIRTVFYKSWWFMLLVGVFLIAVVHYIYRYRISQKEKVLMLEKKAYSLEKEKALVMYESLKQQLNPHFLFNSLTSLSSLISSNPVNAKQFLDRMSKIYRYILKSRDSETVPLADEIKLAEIYTQLQQTRFKDGLHVHINIEPEQLHRKLAPVTIQNLVENAIKHNIIDATTPLVIEIFVQDGWLVVKNNNQVKTFVESSNKQGLASMQSLYHYLSGKQIIIQEDKNYFTIKIPLL